MTAETTLIRTKRFVARKAAIVSSAISVINQKGVRGMTLADVATRLNLVPTGVVYYFKNKEALAAAVFLHGLRRFVGMIEIAAEAATVRARIGALLSANVDARRRSALGEGEPLVAFNDVRALNYEPVNKAYVDMFRSARGLLSGPETASLPRPALNARAHLLISEILWAAAWLHRYDIEDYSRTSQRFAAILSDGVMAPGAQWNPIALPALIPERDGPEDAGELFLRAATQLINEEGYVGASVEKISARLNVTKGAFYHHHETKDELVVACFQRTFQVMRRAIDQADEVCTTGLQSLTTIATALVEYQLTGKAPLLRTSALTSAPEAMQPELLASFDRISNRFASLISDGVADGSMRPVDANVGAQAITAMINAAGELHHWVPDITAATVTDLFVRPLFEGLLSPAAEAKKP